MNIKTQFKQMKLPACVCLLAVAMITGCDSGKPPEATDATAPDNATDATTEASAPLAPGELAPGLLKGYLPQDGTPNSLELVPAPPAADSAGFALDEEVAQSSFKLRDSARWELAILDADLSFPNAAGTFSCALDAPITEGDTPALYRLLRRSMTDAGLSTYTAKNHYERKRPFMENGQPVCTPNQKAALEKDGSYPSGHTTVGWTWALILAEIDPDRADQILERGREYGISRNVCNVHWHSDVVQGRLMGASAFALLQANDEFQADLAAAKGELAAVRHQGLAPTRDCDAEAAALAIPDPI